MRVLARDRRIPELPRELRRVRGLMLTPLGPDAARLVTDEPEVPDSRLRDAAETALRLTVLVPAHDERLTIAATLESLWGQTRPPDRVIVVADNCTDDTAVVARQHEAEVFTTIDNSHKKAGALNQALTRMFGAGIDVRDVVMVMDADSVIVPEFLQTALQHLEADSDLWQSAESFTVSRRRPDRAVAAQRVCPVRARDRPPQRPGIRADRNGGGVPRLCAQGGGRRPWLPDPR